MRNPANARLVLRLRFFIVSNFLFWININKESSPYYVWRRTENSYGNIEFRLPSYMLIKKKNNISKMASSDVNPIYDSAI